MVRGVRNILATTIVMATALLGCTETIDNRLPYRPVNLELDLTYQDKELNGILSHKIYTQQNIDQANEQTGFGGVLVYHGVSSAGTDAFFAFDAACPNESSSSVKVQVDETSIYAICTRCGSKFDLSNGIGNPVEGPCATEKQGLRIYRVDRNGQKLYVHN